MNIVDLAILVILAFGGIIGFKRGFLKETVSFLGFALVIILSFLLKNTVSAVMYKNLPFINFDGIFKGVTSLNILLYEIIAFLLVFSVLMVILRVVMLATSVFEKILRATFILSIPSKLCGAVVGVLHYYFIIFIVLYISSFPIFNVNYLNNSNYKNKILNETPVLTGFIQNTNEMVEEFNMLKEKYKTIDDSKKFNYEVLDLFLKHKIITVDSLKVLEIKGKIDVDNFNSLIEKYERVR
ncbi:MAG TPA: CvpA family protein [Tenericutes bacterium]|nr:CvpA family protein [Mycoplasmatota bacterium]